MKNLQLILIKKWFDMTKPEIKKEDYRSITPYWCNRLLLFDGKEKSKQWWIDEFFDIGTIEDIAENLILLCKFKSFDINIMTLGYPKKDDPERTLKFEHSGIEIRTGNPEWGAEPNKLYFVIKHGKRL